MGAVRRMAPNSSAWRLTTRAYSGHLRRVTASPMRRRTRLTRTGMESMTGSAGLLGTELTPTGRGSPAVTMFQVWLDRWRSSSTYWTAARGILTTRLQSHRPSTSTLTARVLPRWWSPLGAHYGRGMVTRVHRRVSAKGGPTRWTCHIVLGLRRRLLTSMVTAHWTFS